jgi:glutathione synthase/RimK-type ligase-like ATP-grasp enzyme
MFETIKHTKIVTKLRKTLFYSHLRQYFPIPDYVYVDDRDKINDAEIVNIEWPSNVKKPRFGIVRDYGIYPRWTKYCRFLENNGFEYGIYNIHAHNWIETAANYDVIIGIVSNEIWRLYELREKYYFLETYLGKVTCPRTGHMNLYENKILEAYISKVCGLPFAKTYVSYDKEDALHILENLNYPAVSKVVPSSGSVGVELVLGARQGRKMVQQAFSRQGRRTHIIPFRQKNYIYFQEFVPNDGYDIRVIVVGDWVFGYYRRTLEGDFRASGMNQIEMRALPEEAMKIARKVYGAVKSPMLVVDMVHGLDGNYRIVEFSPVCQVELPEDLVVNGVPGVYIFDDDETFHFEAGRYWVHELVLKEFLLKDYLLNLKPNNQ